MTVKFSLVSQPVRRLLIISFIIISLIPVAVLGIKIYQAAWENAWREINEKHRLLAMNLASPLNIYVEDHRNMLGLLSDELAALAEADASDDDIRQTLLDSFVHLNGFNALVLLNPEGTTRVLSHRHAEPAAGSDRLYADESCYIRTRETETPQISGIKASPITGKPTLILSQPVNHADGRLVGVLLGELRIELIESLRRNIHFGVKGHSAIVDNFGRVIAHPNPDWMTEMRDLSKLSIIQKMMAGETGVTEFYSPHIKSNMVAGYTAVPGLGWGIMVPQPKSEVEEQVYLLLFAQLEWAFLGMLIAITLAIWLAGRITRPINRLAESADRLKGNEFRGELVTITEAMPTEIGKLSVALRELVHGLQDSKQEIEVLNESLEYRIDIATKKLRDANMRLERSAREADEANIAKTRFLANMSHELRTPLNAVIGYTNLVYEEADEAGYTAALPDLRKIETAAKHLLTLINDILDLSKIEAGKMALILEEVELSRLVREVTETATPLMQTNRNSLVVNCDNDIGSMRTDVTKLRQTLLNLLSNAAKFTDHGTVTLSVERSQQYGEDWIHFTVADTGIGIDAEDIDQLFDAFSQADANLNRKHGGTGLGLAICRHFSHMLEGNITTESTPGEGSRFTLSLPATGPEHA
jgi:signal transduction histidine kinase